MSKSAAKKRKIVYKDDPNQRVAELEEFLFGSKGDAKELFSKRVEESDDDDVTLKDLLSGGPAPMFFEDKGGDDEMPNIDLTDDGESSSEDEEAEARDADATSSGDEAEKEQKEEAVERAEDVPAAEGAPGKALGKRVPVWQDPADFKIDINLAGKARLRKLRESQKQKNVSGKQYEAALRKQHTALNPRTTWAAIPKKEEKRKAESDEEDEDDLEMLTVTAGGLIAGRQARIPPGSIETSRLKDANAAAPSKAVVQSVAWHPSAQLFMTAGLDKKIRLFKVDAQENPLVQGVYLEDCPIQQACWAEAGSKIVATGRRPYFYLYDLASSKVERISAQQGAVARIKSLESCAVSNTACGENGSGLVAFLGDQGHIPLVSLGTKQWAANLKIPGNVRCATWAPSSAGEQLITLGKDGIIHTWDMRMRRCLHQVRDYGNNEPTSLAVSPDGRYAATGSASGIVNVYSRDANGVVGLSADATGLGHKQPHRPSTTVLMPALGGSVPTGQPLREVMNLTTAVDSLTFSHDSQLLAFSSRLKKDSMRLLHLQSCTVFSNWPTARSPLHYVHSVAFSPHSGFLTIGNARGRALLYRLHYYQEA